MTGPGRPRFGDARRVEVHLYLDVATVRRIDELVTQAGGGSRGLIVDQLVRAAPSTPRSPPPPRPTE